MYVQHFQLTALCQMVVVVHASLTLAMQVHFLAASYTIFGYGELDKPIKHY